jgi:hypothetical protein
MCFLQGMISWTGAGNVRRFKTDWSPLADGGTGLAAQLLKRRLLDVRHNYYHG